MKATLIRAPHKIFLAITAILVITGITTAQIVYNDDSEIEIAVYKAILGPVYHQLPDGRKVEVKAEIYYPSTLVYSGEGPFLFPPIRTSIYCNWTGWGATVIVGLLEGNYSIDPTTLKPRQWDFRLASGGCIIGPGSAIYAKERPYTRYLGECSFNLTLTSRLLNMTSGIESALSKYFFKISLSLYDEKTGSVLPGGYIDLYSAPKYSPSALIIVGNYHVIARTGATIIIASSRNTQSPLTPSLISLIVFLGVFLALMTYLVSRRLRK